MRLFVTAILLLTACSTPKVTTSTTHSLEAIQESQERRTARFDNLVGGGVIEFTWTDDKGTHHEQGELDFWKQGDSISLRISKLGELIAWFGGSGTEIWFFDLMGDEPTLTLGGEQGMFNDIEIALTLLGLNSLPRGEKTMSDGVVQVVDNQQRTWNATYDESGNRPLQIEFNDESHNAIAVHRKGIRVEIEDLHELHWPETGGLIDLQDNQGNTEIKISFSFLSTIVKDEPMDRVMSLEYLQRSLKPTKILQGSRQ